MKRGGPWAPFFLPASRRADHCRGVTSVGLAVADLDDDGDQDVFVANDRSANHLYGNDRDRLHEFAAEAGVGYAMSGRTEGGCRKLPSCADSWARTTLTPRAHRRGQTAALQSLTRKSRAVDAGQAGGAEC